MNIGGRSGGMSVTPGNININMMGANQCPGSIPGSGVVDLKYNSYMENANELLLPDSMANFLRDAGQDSKL